jgi:hypothetical protein
LGIIGTPIVPGFETIEYCFFFSIETRIQTEAGRNTGPRVSAIFRTAIFDEPGMFIEFDQNTIANMTAALDLVCKKIPAEKDTNEIRRQIADELVRSARSGNRSLAGLQSAGFAVLTSHTQSQSRYHKLRQRLANIAGRLSGKKLAS